MDLQSFAAKIAAIDRKALAETARRCRGDILTMTTLAGSGHPGGSMSSIDLLLSLYAAAEINPENFHNPSRDRIIVSHGHIASCVYSSLAANGFIPHDEAVSQFRKAGSLYEGHIERSVPGVEWTTGNLGQGLSAAAGFAVAGRAHKKESDIYVLMGDGEHEKGQISEARHFIKKFGFSNITVIVDYNHLQICGDIHDVMPSLNIAASYEADGWLVIEIDGHNFNDILGALIKAKSSSLPVCIIANTVMGKGVSFMENNHAYHGSPLKESQYNDAMKELGLPPVLDKFRALRNNFHPKENLPPVNPHLEVNTGEPITYGADVKTDNRSAFGKAIEQIADLNKDSMNPVVVFDCDLSPSVKTGAIEKKYPENFYQCGIAEHHTAVCAGAASANGVISFFADFGMFGVDEVYNQHRMNGINGTDLKLVTTHVGVDVGEDGRTHMCIDYIGLMRNIFGFKIIVPADPNQTDRAVRYAAKTPGNVHVAMGRSKTNVIVREDGTPFFAGDYVFRYGVADIIREGEYPIFTYGAMIGRAIKVHDILAEKGISTSVINVSSPIFISNSEGFFDKGIAFVYEDHIPETGLFCTLSQIVALTGKSCSLVPFGIHSFPVSGSPDEVFKYVGIDEEAVAAKIIKELHA